MRNGLVLSMAMVMGIGVNSCRSDPQGELEPKRVEPETAVKLPDYSAAAAPWLIRWYGERKFESEIRPLLETPGALEAVRMLESQLLETRNLEAIRCLAYALAALRRPESKRALLKKLGGARGGPKRGGVVFGGDREVAHYALIWSLAQLEGRIFEESPDHFKALMDWWMNYPVAVPEEK